MPRAVVSRTPETNAVTTYYVSCLAGPRIAKKRVAKGEAVELTEYQARAELASGALVTDKALVDDPWGEAKADAAAKAKAADGDGSTPAKTDGTAATDKPEAAATADGHGTAGAPGA